jgi:hypothetical protein
VAGRCSSWGRIGRPRKARPDGRNPPLLTRIHYDLARLFLEGAQAGWSPTSQKTRPDSTSDAIRFSRPANDATRFTTSFQARIPVVWMDGGLRLSAPTIARSAVPTPPSLRCTSPNCDQAKTRRSARAAVSVQTECSRYADALIGRTYVMFVKSTEARTQELQRLCRLFADRMQDGDKQVALGPTWYCPMLQMATIKRTRTLHPASLGSIKGENAARHPFVWPVRHHPPWRKHL